MVRPSWARLSPSSGQRARGYHSTGYTWGVLREEPSTSIRVRAPHGKPWSVLCRPMAAPSTCSCGRSSTVLGSGPAPATLVVHSGKDMTQSHSGRGCIAPFGRCLLHCTHLFRYRSVAATDHDAFERLEGCARDGGSRNRGGRPTTRCRSTSTCRRRRGKTLRSGMDKGVRASGGGAGGGSAVRLCNLVAQRPRDAEGAVQAGSGEGTNIARERATRNHLLQDLQKPDSRYRAGPRDRRSDAGHRQIAGILS